MRHLFCPGLIHNTDLGVYRYHRAADVRCRGICKPSGECHEKIMSAKFLRGIFKYHLLFFFAVCHKHTTYMTIGGATVGVVFYIIIPSMVRKQCTGSLKATGGMTRGACFLQPPATIIWVGEYGVKAVKNLLILWRICVNGSIYSLPVGCYHRTPCLI